MVNRRFGGTVVRAASIVLGVTVLGAGTVESATYYVDATCASNGNGLTDSCAAQSGGAGRFNSLSGCVSAMAGGDTCSVHPGDYVGVFNLAGKNGTPSAYTTIKAWNPAQRPRLCRLAGCADTYTGSDVLQVGALSDALHTSYVKFDGIEVHGYFKLFNSDHIVLTNSDLQGVGDCDGNAAVVRLQNSDHLQVDHNRIHGLLGCSQSAGGTAMVKMFIVRDSVIEYNTIDASDGNQAGPWQGIVDDKDTPLRNTIRYNYAIGGTSHDNLVRIGMQHNAGQQGGDQIYGNVAVRLGLVTLEGTATDLPWNVHHNTFISAGSHAGLDMTGSSGFVNFTFANNIIDSPPGSNVSITSVNWSKVGSYSLDYNRYDSDANFYAGGNGYSGGTAYGDVAGWRSALQGAGCAGCEAHSTEASTACAFTAGTDTPYHVKAGDPCATASSSGGELGAYGVTACVGHLCGVTTVPGCGNGIVESGEACDDGNVTTEAACPYGQATCTACNAACTQILNLTGPYCGDGIVNGGEACDRTQLNGATCVSLGFASGTLACGGTCAYDTSACVTTRSSSDECASPSPNWVACDGFEAGNMNYWSNDLNTDGGRLSATSSAPHSGSFAAQESYAAGTSGDGWGAKFIADHPLLSAPGAAMNDLYLRWWSKFSPGFTFPSTSAKSWIVAAFESWSAGYPGPNSWSPYYVIVETGSNGRPTLTLHRKVPLDEWQSLPQNVGTPVAPSLGDWHEIQVHLKLNTPGASDGVAEMWIDGAQKSSYTGVNFSGTYSRYGWNHLILSPYASPSSPANQTQYWDNAVASRAFITTGATDTTAPPAPTIRRTDTH